MQNHAAHVVAVSRSPVHGFSKEPQPSISLLAGQGVQGDAHCGETVQHLYLKRKNPLAPNRMQVHLFQAELLDDLAELGFQIGPGQIGENILTRGLSLIDLPEGTHLQLGEAVIELTCLRHPCVQIDRFRPGLQKHMSRRDGTRLQYLAGVMGTVRQGGQVTTGDRITAELPSGPHRRLTT